MKETKQMGKSELISIIGITFIITFIVAFMLGAYTARYTWSTIYENFKTTQIERYCPYCGQELKY